ncbi:MAG: ATP-binding protein, partial [Caldimonas manganoxidans]|nr:ATP-binding protein [Caldimonas manganoxidans]
YKRQALEAVERAKNAPFRPAQDNLAAARGLISVSLAVFRLVQEALTNVQKHARASRVDLVLETRGDRLLLRLRDDGVGLDPAQTRKLKSHGLRGMKHRVDAFGGRFEIGPAAGGGTVLTVEIPLTPVPEAADDTDI